MISNKEIKYVLILMGPCGGGKTTISEKLSMQLPGFKHIEIDHIKKEKSGSVHPSSQDRQNEINGWFQEASRRACCYLKKRQNVILDEAFSMRKYIDLALSCFKDLNIQEIKVEIKYSLEEHIRRYTEKEDSYETRTPQQIERYYNNYRIEENTRKVDLSFNDPQLSVDEICSIIISHLQEKGYKGKSY